MRHRPLKTTCKLLLIIATSFAFACNTSFAQLSTGWKAHDKNRAVPAVVDPGKAAFSNSIPSDAIVLFDGKDLSNWDGPNGKEPKWIVKDGVMESVAGAGYVYTKEKFGDCQLHIEWASPANVKGNGQGRGNSGVFLPGGYEVQVLDSFNNKTYADGGAASIYGQFPPMVNASRGPGQWQSYDIIFRMPTFEDGKMIEKAMVTVLHNGVVVQHGTRPLGPTSWILHNKSDPAVESAPIGLQDHGNPVRYRNIWIRNLQRDTSAGTYAKARPFTDQEIQNLTGSYEGGREVKELDGKLWIRITGRFMEMAAYEDGTYGLRKSAGKISFTTEDSGKVTEIELKLDAGMRGKFSRTQ